MQQIEDRKNSLSSLDHQTLEQLLSFRPAKRECASKQRQDPTHCSVFSDDSDDASESVHII